MVKFIAFHITFKKYTEIYSYFLFESMKKLNKGIGKILQKSIYIISAPSMHIHPYPYVGGNCGEFSFVCMPSRSTRDPRENNFHLQRQKYVFSSMFMYVHYRDQIYYSCCYNMAYIKSKEKHFFWKLK